MTRSLLSGLGKQSHTQIRSARCLVLYLDRERRVDQALHLQLPRVMYDRPVAPRNVRRIGRPYSVFEDLRKHLEVLAEVCVCNALTVHFSHK